MSTITFDFRHYYRKGERRESDQIAYQWDLGHVAEIYVPVNATYEIHYCFADYPQTEDYAVESTTAAEDGGYKLTAHIPNELFERSGELKVYVIGADDNHVLTTYEGYITIRGRTKPEDYVDDDPENEATRILTEAREARDAAIEAAEQAEAAASQSAAQASIAAVYDATKTYAIGDYCLYDGQLYECTTEISTPEAWTAAHWTATTVGTELNDIKGDVTGLKEELNDLAIFPVDTVLLDTTVTATTGTTIPNNIEGLTAGDVVRVTIQPDIESGTVYNVLTTSVVGGPTIRRIDMSTVGLNSVTINLEGNEKVLVVRCANTSEQTRVFKVDAIKIGTGTPAIKPGVTIPTDKTLSVPDKPADSKTVGDTIAEVNSHLLEVATFPTSETLKDETIQSSTIQTLSVPVVDLSTGDVINVSVIPSVTEDTAWDVLTVNEGGSTVRRINMSADSLTQITFTIASGEVRINVRFINYSATAKTCTVKVRKFVGGLPTIRPGALPAFPELDKSKRIVWFGTSIPAGNYANLAYPNVIASKLGVTVYNEAVGSSRARASWAEFITQNNPLGLGSGYNSSIKAMGYSLAEKQYFIDNYASFKDNFTDTHPDTLSDSDKLAIKNYSYERKLYRYLTAKESVYNTVNTDGFIGDVDIYVLDHGYNDVTTRYASDTTVPEFGAEHEMYYYAGAMNRYIKIIMENNVHAKIIIVSHYANTEGKKDATAVEMQNKIAEYWNIPIINVYKEAGWTDLEITVDGSTKTVRQAWLPDGVHPASDSTGKAVERYVNILLPYIKDCLCK